MSDCELSMQYITYRRFIISLHVVKTAVGRTTRTYQKTSIRQKILNFPFKSSFHLLLMLSILLVFQYLEM